VRENPAKISRHRAAIRVQTDDNAGVLSLKQTSPFDSRRGVPFGACGIGNKNKSAVEKGAPTFGEPMSHN
jgi:hypothetical protein